MSKAYELSLSKNYVSGWSAVDAIKELLQNAIDSDSPFEHRIVGERLEIISRFASLSARTLVLGETSKAERKDAIGQHGEGFKLALLVLLREGYEVRVRNNGVQWFPYFDLSKSFGVEVLHIEETELACTGLEFVIDGISDETMQEVRQSCLLLQDSDPAAEVLEVKQGFILAEHPGKLYVGGLYICDTNMKFGYNVRPAYLKLERDRKTVSSFDLAWLTKDMWVATGEFTRIAKMITDSVPDVEYVEHNCPEMLKQAVYDQFTENNPGGIVAKDPDHLRDLVAKGMEKVVYVNKQTHNIVSRSSHYAPTLATIAKAEAPEVILSVWYEENKKYLRRLPQTRLKKILEDAKKWKTR
jgi:hypothetical protein